MPQSLLRLCCWRGARHDVRGSLLARFRRYNVRPMNSRAVFLAAILAAGCGARASDWPQWRGPNRDGISAEADWSSQWPADGPKPLWRATVGIGCSSVSVVGDRVFTMGNQCVADTVWCCDAKTGLPVWKHTYANPLDARNYEGGPGATPTVDGNFVFTLSRTGQLFCLDARTGKPVWSKHLVNDFGGKVPKWGYSGSPLVADRKSTRLNSSH